MVPTRYVPFPHPFQPAHRYHHLPTPTPLKPLTLFLQDWYSILDLYGGADSQINTVPVNASAFSDRGSLFDFQHYGYANDSTAPFPADIEPFIQGLNDVLPNAMPDVSFRAYVNYIDPTLTPEQAHTLYYGESTYERLVGIKREVDPEGVFWNPLAIGVM